MSGSLRSIPFFVASFCKSDTALAVSLAMSLGLTTFITPVFVKSLPPKEPARFAPNPIATVNPPLLSEPAYRFTSPCPFRLRAGFKAISLKYLLAVSWVYASTRGPPTAARGSPPTPKAATDPISVTIPKASGA